MKKVGILLFWKSKSNSKLDQMRVYFNLRTISMAENNTHHKIEIFDVVEKPLKWTSILIIINLTTGISGLKMSRKRGISFNLCKASVEENIIVSGQKELDLCAGIKNRQIILGWEELSRNDILQSTTALPLYVSNQLQAIIKKVKLNS